MVSTNLLWLNHSIELNASCWLNSFSLPDKRICSCVLLCIQNQNCSSLWKNWMSNVSEFGLIDMAWFLSFHCLSQCVIYHFEQSLTKLCITILKFLDVISLLSFLCLYTTAVLVFILEFGSFCLGWASSFESRCWLDFLVQLLSWLAFPFHDCFGVIFAELFCALSINMAAVFFAVPESLVLPALAAVVLQAGTPPHPAVWREGSRQPPLPLLPWPASPFPLSNSSQWPAHGVPHALSKFTVCLVKTWVSALWVREVMLFDPCVTF